MSKSFPCALLLAVNLLAAAHAEDVYIGDSIYVPLRRGIGTEYAILHKGLPTGTRLELLEQDSEQGWSLVRTQGGLEGWLPSRYLSRQPGARNEIRSARLALEQPDDGSVALGDALARFIAESQAARVERDLLQEQVVELRRVSGSAMEVDERNKRLAEQVEMLKNEVEVLKTDNRRLSDNELHKWFIKGVWATGVGGLLTLVLPRLFGRRRKRSEWA